VSLDVAGRRCVILGGGPEATDKAGRLVRAGARVQVIAEEVEPALEAMAQAGELGWAARGWIPVDLRDAYLVYVTPEARERADEAHQLALANGAQICTIDVPDQCTFANPAVVEVGGLRIALSSGGTAPALLKRMKHGLERGLATPSMEAFVRAMADLRERLPREERYRLREAVEGFHLEVRVTFPPWFQETGDDEQEGPTTERTTNVPDTMEDP
jgi:siroheme synthase-like protein